MHKSLFYVKLGWHQNKKGGNNNEKSEIYNKIVPGGSKRG